MMFRTKVIGTYGMTGEKMEEEWVGKVEVEQQELDNV
jgi:hypothetical protein